MNSARTQLSFTPTPQVSVGKSGVGPAPDQGVDERAEPRWMRDLLVLQVTSIFVAGLFMAVWFTH